VERMDDPKKKEKARRILGHIRQFNPFNNLDMDENEKAKEVIEDFLNFSRIQIESL